MHEIIVMEGWFKTFEHTFNIFSKSFCRLAVFLPLQLNAFVIAALYWTSCHWNQKCLTACGATIGLTLTLFTESFHCIHYMSHQPLKQILPHVQTTLPQSSVSQLFRQQETLTQTDPQTKYTLYFTGVSVKKIVARTLSSHSLVSIGLSRSAYKIVLMQINTWNKPNQHLNGLLHWIWLKIVQHSVHQLLLNKKFWNELHKYTWCSSCVLLWLQNVSLRPKMSWHHWLIQRDSKIFKCMNTVLPKYSSGSRDNHLNSSSVQTDEHDHGISTPLF